MPRQSFDESHFIHSGYFLTLCAPRGACCSTFKSRQNLCDLVQRMGEVQRQQQRQQVEGTTRRIRAEAKTSNFANLDTETSSFLNRFASIKFCQSSFDNTEGFMAGTRSKV